MVQVDIIWSYAFGATLAASAARQLKKEEKPFDNRFYTYVLLFLATLFAPSGVYLLWQFPNWETMQVARSHADIPAWLVVLFAITNITQGILGYYSTWRLIIKGKFYAAHVNWIVAWVLFWSLLVMGWDTTGWQRFLYDSTMNNGVLWTPGTHMGLRFFTSNVFLTLVGMAIPIGPALAIPIAKWVREGLQNDKTISKDKIPGMFKLMVLCLVGSFGITLAMAIANGLLVFWLRDLLGSVLMAYVIGLPLFWVLAYFLLLKKGRPLYVFAKQFFVEEPQA
jgi:hypothetical protein